MAANPSFVRQAIAVLYVLNEARRINRLIRACNGDTDAAMRIYRDVKRAEGWRGVG